MPRVAVLGIPPVAETQETRSLRGCCGPETRDSGSHCARQPPAASSRPRLAHPRSMARKAAARRQHVDNDGDQNAKGAVMRTGSVAHGGCSASVYSTPRTCRSVVRQRWRQRPGCMGGSAKRRAPGGVVYVRCGAVKAVLCILSQWQTPVAGCGSAA